MRFEFFRRRTGGSADFVYPFGEPPRTAVLDAGFRLSKNLRYVDPHGKDVHAKLKKLKPKAIAGSFEDLSSVWTRGYRFFAENQLHAVVVFSESGDELMSERRRDQLWRVFQAPIFEQLLLPDRTVLAAECEAHVGLHLLATPADLYLKKVKFEGKLCECGKESPRLLPIPALVARANSRRVA